MFARFVEARTKPGKREQVSNLLLNDLLPIMQRHRGFVGMVGLFSDADANEGGGLSLWETKEDAERFYNSMEYLSMLNRFKPLVEDIKVRTFTVTRTTFQKAMATGA